MLDGISIMAWFIARINCKTTFEDRLISYILRSVRNVKRSVRFFLEKKRYVAHKSDIKRGIKIVHGFM